MTNRLEELIWMELEGALGADEARELAELRAGSPGAAALESEIRELAAELGRVEDVAPPADLGRRVLSAIEPVRAPAAEPRGGRVLELKPRVAPAAAAGGWVRWRRWGYLAAGLVIAGVLIFQLLARQGASESPSELVGTVPAAPPAGAEPVPDGGGAVAGMPDSVGLWRRDGRLRASLAPGPGESVFSIHAPGLEVEQVDFVDGARGTYEEAPGRVTLRVTGPGRVEARLRLGRPDRPFRVSASGGDIGSFDKHILLSQLSER